MKCNFVCTGCYSRDYSLDDELTLDEADRLLAEASRLGVVFMVITGGEPLLKKGMLDLLRKHNRIVFLLFNNGSCIDRDSARVIGGSTNIIPMLSIEGTRAMTDERRGQGVHDQVMHAMDLLRRYRSFFGFSVMVTSRNSTLLQSDAFYDDLVRRGCGIGLLVGYVPATNEAPMELVPDESARQALRRAIARQKRRKDLIMLQMPEDEYERDGRCMAAGRGFAHVNARGDIEPCPFAQVATHSVRNGSLEQALRSPLFAAIRNRSELCAQPALGCALFEQRERLKGLYAACGAYETVQSCR
jgi:MoaA/NifB/PqqE/SkfB family radical SAM enzyme